MDTTVVEPVVVIKLSDADTGERLDKVLATRCTEYSRAQIQRWIESGRVDIGGVVASRKTKVVTSAEVVMRPAPPEVPNALPQNIPLEIVFEDDDILVIDKQAGLVVHPAPGHADGTLVNAVLHHTHIDCGGDALRPGIVHRLDKDTSGVMVVAKTAFAHEQLVRAFSQRNIERSYLAIALGAPPSKETYDTWHGRHPSHRKKFSSRVTSGKRAITHLDTLERLHGAALVRCTLQTGRTHQIRVHLADHGHPILGDSAVRYINRRSAPTSCTSTTWPTSAPCRSAWAHASDDWRTTTFYIEASYRHRVRAYGTSGAMTLRETILVDMKRSCSMLSHTYTHGLPHRRFDVCLATNEDVNDGPIIKIMTHQRRYHTALKKITAFLNLVSHHLEEVIVANTICDLVLVVERKIA